MKENLSYIHNIIDLNTERVKRDMPKPKGSDRIRVVIFNRLLTLRDIWKEVK